MSIVHIAEQAVARERHEPPRPNDDDGRRVKRATRLMHETGEKIEPEYWKR